MNILVFSEKTNQTAFLTNPDIILNDTNKEVIFRTYHTFVSVNKRQLDKFDININDYYEHIVCSSSGTSGENGEYINAIPSAELALEISMDI